MPRAEFELSTEDGAEILARVAAMSGWIEFDEKQAHLCNEFGDRILAHVCEYAALHDVALRVRYYYVSHAAQGRALTLELAV